MKPLNCLCFRLRITVHRVLWELLPPPQYRKPLTWRNVPNAFAYLVPFCFMAYLVRRRETRVIRLLVLPTVIVMAIRGTFSYDWFDPRFSFFTWVRGKFLLSPNKDISHATKFLGLFGLTIMGMSIDYALVKNGRFKIGENTLPALHESPPVSAGSSDGIEQNAQSIFPTWLVDVVEVCSALRGFGWDIGRGVHVPTDPRPLDRELFIKATMLTFVKHFLILDFLETIIKFIPGIGTPAGGSIFYASLPLAPRILVSTSIVLLSAALMISGFETIYAAITIVAVQYLGHPPSAWPPLMDNPWAADSLSDFWAKRWHQALRRSFLVFGGIPGGWIAGRVGVVLGAFLVSGMFHECGTYLLGRGFDHRVTVFFAVQGIFVVLERVWKKVTGRRVGGGWGRLWTYFNIIGLGQMCCKYLNLAYSYLLIDTNSL